MNRSADVFYENLLLAFREQIVDGTYPNFFRAAEKAKVSRRTVKRAFEKGYPPTLERGPLPSIRSVLNTPVPSEARAVVPPPPAPPPMMPAPTAPPSHQVPEEVLAAEQKAVHAVRHAAEGVAAVSTTLLAALMPCALAVRRQLERSLDSDIIDVRFVADMLQRVSDSVSKSSSALARLVEAQSTLSGRPNQRVSVDDSREAAAMGVAARAALAELSSWSERERGRRQLEPIDVTPISEETNA